MYPFGDLPGNLVAFCDLLRLTYGFGLGSAEVHDAARALEIVDLAEERAVRDALRPILSGTADEAAAFDGAFTAFFFPGPRGAAQTERPRAPRGREAAREAQTRTDRKTGGAGGAEAAEAPAAAARLTPDLAATGERETSAREVRARYSPLEAEEAPEPTELGPVEDAWRDAARALVRRLLLGPARRWRPAPAGRRFDLRRTLRASLHTGGEALVVRWLRRPKRAPGFVLLVDGSRSMSKDASTALRIAVAIATATVRVEVFTFSTRLERITDQVRRAAAGETLRLGHHHAAWGGGTAIGASLREFLRQFGGRLLRRQTLVVIASDGLDVGETDLLRDALREIRRRSAGIVWLNPLLDAAGYEPIAQGIRAARPFVTVFAAASDAAALARLSREVRIHA